MYYQTLKNKVCLKVVRKYFQGWLVQEKKKKKSQNQSDGKNHGKLFQLSRRTFITLSESTAKFKWLVQNLTAKINDRVYHAQNVKSNARQCYAGAYSEPRQPPKTECFARVVNGYQSLITSTTGSIPDV